MLSRKNRKGRAELPSDESIPPVLLLFSGVSGALTVPPCRGVKLEPVASELGSAVGLAELARSRAGVSSLFIAFMIHPDNFFGKASPFLALPSVWDDASETKL